MKILGFATALWLPMAALVLSADGAGSAYGVRLGENRMPNGDFEGAGGWRTLGAFAHLEKGAGLNGSTGLVIEKKAGPMVNCPHSERFAVEPGAACRIEMWVKDFEGDGKPLVPYVVGCDANGKTVGITGCRPERVTDNDPRDDGWYRVEGVTMAMPADVRTAEVTAWADDKVVGRICVDDISIYPISANTMGAVVCSAYQSRASSGSVTFKAAYTANPERYPAGTLRGEIEFAGTGGTVRQAAVVRDGTLEATVPVGSFAFGGNDVRLRLLAKDGTTLGDGTCRFMRDRTDPVRRVSFDRYGRTLVDGKPFLPLGLYFSKVSPESLSRLREGSFNCIMPYRPKDGDMELCQSNGIWMIASVSGWFRELAKATPEQADEINGRLWKKVERLRSHPALLAWYLADEVPLQFESILRERKEKVNELDPSHPTWIVLDKPDHVYPLARGFDVIGVDPYPVGNHGSEDRTAIGIAAGWAETAKSSTFGFRPMWNVPQLFNWGSYRKKEAEKNPGVRWPTRIEMRSMVWQSIAAGANGLVGYSFFNILEQKDMDEKDREAKWGEVCKIFNEVKAHERELLSVPGPAVTCHETGLVARTWGTEADGVFVLVCNTRRQPVSGRVTVGGRPFRVSLGPLEVKMRTMGKQNSEAGSVRRAAKDSKTTLAKEALQKYVDSGELPDAISVFYKDDVQETCCIGYADVAQRRPVEMDNVYMQCSQTKGFCGVCIAQLVERGLLDLDDPVSKFLPEFKELWIETSKSNGVRKLQKAEKTLTVRMCMNHTGGFPFELANYQAMGGWSRRMPLRSVAATAAALPILFEPGTRAKYSNVGIDIGAAVVEQIMGQRWERYLQENVLDPLEMKDTGFWPSDAQLSKAIGMYDVKGGRPAQWRSQSPLMQRPYNDDRVFPSAGAGLWTTAADQLKFYKMLMNLGVGENGARILKEETVKAILAQSTRPKGMEGYSLGLYAPAKDAEDQWFGHGGAWDTNCMVNWHKRQLKLWACQFTGGPQPWNKARDAAAEKFFNAAVDTSGADAYTGRVQ